MTDDELKQLVASLAILQKETDRQFRETDRRMAKSREETDRRIAKSQENVTSVLAESQKETDRRIGHWFSLVS